jgi:hypothetical protein
MDWWGRANKFENPLGEGPGKGCLLMRFSDLQNVDLTQDNTLTFTGTTAAKTYTLQNITLLNATCLSPGSATDPNAVFLLEVADIRFHLARIPINTGYNVWMPDGSDYLPVTLETSEPGPPFPAWGWQDVVDDIVTQLGLVTGQFVLPFTPDSEPQNLSYWGGFAWSALCDVLNRLACAAFYDPTTNTFSIVRLGEDSSGADGVVAGLSGERVWDTYPVDPLRMWMPEFVRVMFIWYPRPDDGTSPYFAQDVALPVTSGVVAGTYVVLNDDAAALGSWLDPPTNAGDLAVRASERAADWLRKRSGYERPFKQVYRDFVPDVPLEALGSEYGLAVMNDDADPRMRELMRTELSSKPDHLLERWASLSRLAPWFPPSAGSGGESPCPVLSANSDSIDTTITSPVADTIYFLDFNTADYYPGLKNGVNLITASVVVAGTVSSANSHPMIVFMYGTNFYQLGAFNPGGAIIGTQITVHASEIIDANLSTPSYVARQIVALVDIPDVTVADVVLAFVIPTSTANWTVASIALSFTGATSYGNGIAGVALNEDCGSGSGGGGGNITRSSLGTFTSSGIVGSTTGSVFIESGLMILTAGTEVFVNVGLLVAVYNAVSPSTLAVNFVPVSGLTVNFTKVAGGSISGTSGLGGAYIFATEITATTSGHIAVIIDDMTASVCAAAVEVAGLVNFTIDQTATGGTSVGPVTTTVASEYAQAAFSGLVAGTTGSGFTTGQSVASGTITLVEGYEVLASTGSVTATYTGTGTGALATVS